MATKKKKSKKNNKPERNVDLQSMSLVVLGILLGFIIYTPAGSVGEFIRKFLIGSLFGEFSYALPILFVIMGIYVIFKDYSRLKLNAFQFILLIISITSLMTCFDYPYVIQDGSTNIFENIGMFCGSGCGFQAIEHAGGGLVGSILTVPLIAGFGLVVPKVIFILAIIVLTFVITGIAFSSIVIGIKDFFANSIEKGKENVHEYARQRRERKEEEKEEEEEPEPIPVRTKKTVANAQVAKAKNKKFQDIMAQTEVIDSGKQLAISDLDLEDYDEPEEELEEVEPEPEEEIIEEVPIKETPKKKTRVLTELKPKEEPKEEPKAEVVNIDTSDPDDYEGYIFPPVSLLSEGEAANDEYSIKELREVASKLQKTLTSFNVDAKVVNVTRGPAVTQYEVQPNVGVKVSKILGLADDIALNLAAKTIRIEAPIPGKSAVGIEVPNKVKENVTLREVIESDEFQDATSKVTFALGKSINGEPYVSDIAKMPHMLIAGATGSGKSVCINSILVSLLYKAKPNEVKLILIDPKVVELKVYNDIPHLLIPVVTDPKKAAGALNWAVQEMVNRYNLFAEKGVRDIRGYNDLLVQEGEDGVLPQIVIVIDELADLMMVAPGEVEDAIVRLTQMARAAGMHLIIATQRPSVDVVTGIIKANVPSRIAFTVSSQVDSRTILDMAGAEKLLGKGDMLYFPMGESKPIRIQGTYISDKEVETIVDFVKEQNPHVKYNEDVMESFEKANQPPQAVQETKSDSDELLVDAIELAVSMGNASASMLQRKFKIGYARAGRIIDQMEERGIVSGYDGSKPRQVLISEEEWEEMKEAGVDSVKYEEIDEDELEDTDEEEYEEEYENSDEEEYEEESDESDEEEEEEESDEEESDEDEEYESEEEEEEEEYVDEEESDESDDDDDDKND